MVTFVTVYRGASIQSAKMIAVTTDPAIVQDVAARLLCLPEVNDEDDAADTALQLLERGRRRALQYIHAEANGEADEFR